MVRRPVHKAWLLLFSIVSIGAAMAAVRAWPAHGIVDVQDVGRDFQIDGSSIGGVVRARATERGEAGVWVIAETSSLPSRFRRMVVTDDQGRFVVPGLPEGRYELWVRGYGLRDSKRVPAERGRSVTISVDAAPSAIEAARIYPASYWLALLEPPARRDLPAGFESESHWLTDAKLGCIRCHQFGSPIVHSRTAPESWEAHWKLRPGEGRTADTLGRAATSQVFSRWAARIAHGAVPPSPPRPIGVERNVVITQWDWGGKDSYIHDIISTDKRRPTLYPRGRIWGVDFGHDQLWSLDPRTHEAKWYPVPTTNVLSRSEPAPPGAVVYNNPANPHVPIMDGQGRVWIAVQTRRERPEDAPAWVKDVLENVDESAAGGVDPLPFFQKGTHHRQLAFFDTESERFVTVDTVYGTNHLQFDMQDRLWTSGDSVALGMLDTRRFDPSRGRQTESAAQKAFVSIDRSGRSSGGGGYGIGVSHRDGTVWRTNTYIGQTGAPDNLTFAGQNTIVGFDPAARTFRSHVLPPPGRSAVGIDVGADGGVWFGTASGHLGRFDPATERFTYWTTPGPRLKADGGETGSGDFHYNIFVDQYDTSGLGAGTVFLTGANSDAIVVFDPRSERFSVFRVPYPLVMYHRGVDGRIDDPQAGWKGRGLWINASNDPARFIEHGNGVVSQIQVRPHPLAY
jgi:streptogramin lyase